MKVSIVIPTIGRNTLEVVLKALFLNNNFDQIDPEVLVIFDNIEPFKSDLLNHKNVIVLKTGMKSFAGGVRNLGIDKSKGGLLIFIGDDTIPEPDWLQKIVDWHADNPEEEKSLLGKIDWTDGLGKDRFHQWLNTHAQFDFGNLDKGAIPSWRHFYTSNISLKKSFLSSERFDESFEGWGFEDGELGYRLSKKGLSLAYDLTLIVKHDDRQTLASMKQRTKASRINAQRFEDLHPEIKILPRGMKKIILRSLVLLTTPFIFVNEIKWWRAWKSAWLGSLLILGLVC